MKTRNAIRKALAALTLTGMLVAPSVVLAGKPKFSSRSGRSTSTRKVSTPSFGRTKAPTIQRNRNIQTPSKSPSRYGGFTQQNQVRTKKSLPSSFNKFNQTKRTFPKPIAAPQTKIGSRPSNFPSKSPLVSRKPNTFSPKKPAIGIKKPGNLNGLKIFGHHNGHHGNHHGNGNHNGNGNGNGNGNQHGNGKHKWHHNWQFNWHLGRHPWYWGPGHCFPKPICLPRPCPPVQPIILPAPVVAPPVIVPAPQVEVVEPAAELPKVPSGATLELAGANLGQATGQVLLKMGPLTVPAQVREWSQKVTATLPYLVLDQATPVEILIVRADGTLDTTVPIELLPAPAPTPNAAPPTDAPGAAAIATPAVK